VPQPAPRRRGSDVIPHAQRQERPKCETDCCPGSTLCARAPNRVLRSPNDKRSNMAGGAGRMRDSEASSYPHARQVAFGIRSPARWSHLAAHWMCVARRCIVSKGDWWGCFASGRSLFERPFDATIHLVPERPPPRPTIADERPTTGGELLDLIRPPAWHAEAAFRELAASVDFLPVRGVATKAAKACCAGCPVRAECLEYAITSTADLNGVGRHRHARASDPPSGASPRRLAGSCGYGSVPSAGSSFAIGSDSSREPDREITPQL